jgi:SPFH domain / Band 7 family
MLGIRYLKVPPTTHVMQFKRGQVVRQGAGLSFFYFAPNSVLVQVPLASVDVPFVFNEVTADFQDATIQGELTYRVNDAARLTAVLDYSVDRHGRYQSDDVLKLSDRLIHAAQILARSFTQRNKLRELLVASDPLIAAVLDGLRTAPAVAMLGVEVLGLSVLSIKASPEMSKALQAEAREQLLKQADEAIYARRNSAVELERTIKENELNTEIAVEQKKRTVRETQMAAEIAVEEQRASLVDQRVANERKEADARAHALAATLEPLKTIDWRTLMAASGGNDTGLMIATAFRELAENASRIGELNVSPDLLRSLVRSKGK